jgi:ribulose 1,5-bisphosphate synthetase/thiazole synthase
MIFVSEKRLKFSCFYLIVMFGLIRRCLALNVKPTTHSKQIQRYLIFRIFSSNTSKNIAIVGGGLAGLSTAYHLLDKLQGNVHITVIDKADPGEGGASSVAGG